MKRRIGLLLAAIALTTGGIAEHPPAMAADDACVGTGSLQTGPMGLVNLAPPSSSPFSVYFTIGGCVVNTSFFAGGVVTGHCGLFSGRGSINGREFAMTAVGSGMSLTGSVTGFLAVAPDPTGGGSCLAGTATQFIVTGALRTPPPVCPPDWVYSSTKTTVNGVDVWVGECLPTR